MYIYMFSHFLFFLFQDEFKDVIPCRPIEYCVKKYGDDPRDVGQYGTVGPCLGLGSVRCVDNIPPTVNSKYISNNNFSLR